MAEINRLVYTRELKTSIWSEAVDQDATRAYIYYNKRVDSLTLMIVPPETPKRVHYIDEHVALLYTPEDMEVIGVRVEAFERSFLPMYASLQKVWRLSESAGVEMEDFYDLMIFVEQRRPIVINELSKITGNIVSSTGLNLEPVPIPV